MRSIAVASGKGGVGKTMLSANLACWLALENQRVLVFDADLGLANMDIALGLEPKTTLKNVIREGLPVESAITEGPAGMHLLAGGSGIEELIGMGGIRLENLLTQITGLAESYDFLIIDAAAGVHNPVVSCIAAADEACIVCTPEPSSLIDAYAVIKQLNQIKPRAEVAVIVNMADTQRHGIMVFERLKMITGQYLSVQLRFAGAVRRDDSFIACSRQRQLVLLAHPTAPSARDVEDAASQLFFRKLPERQEVNLFDKLKGALSQKPAA